MHSARCRFFVFWEEAIFRNKQKTARRFSASGCDASGGIRTHTGVSPTDFESVTSASSITPAHLSLLAYHTQTREKSQAQNDPFTGFTRPLQAGAQAAKKSR